MMGAGFLCDGCGTTHVMSGDPLVAPAKRGLPEGWVMVTGPYLAEHAGHTPQTIYCAPACAAEALAALGGACPLPEVKR